MKFKGILAFAPCHKRNKYRKNNNHSKFNNFKVVSLNSEKKSELCNNDVKNALCKYYFCMFSFINKNKLSSYILSSTIFMFTIQTKISSDTKR